MPGLTKGLSFHNLGLFVRKRFGDAGWQLLLDSMTSDEQTQLAAVIPVGWYELDLYARLVIALDRTHGAGRPTLIEDYGRFAAEQDVTTIHKFVLKLADPGLILAQSMKLWRRFHDTGEWSILREHRHATGTLTNWGHVDIQLCRELVGYIEVLLGFGRTRQVRVQHSECRARGAAACVFSASWR